MVSAAFLQHGRPGLAAAVATCSDQGVDQIIIVPFFFQLGMHVTRDIPAVIAQEQSRYPRIKITVTDALGSHPLMIDAVLDLAGRACV